MSKKGFCMSSMLLPLLFSLVCITESAPVSSGPDFHNIQYLHNINLTYYNDTLDGLGAIDSFTDVDAQMAASLKDAIHRALFDVAQSSSSVPSLSTTSIQSLSNARVKREDSISPLSLSTTTSSAGITTTQPYGTDEEFYARTDLVHFHVNIDDLEGSGS